MRLAGIQRDSITNGIGIRDVIFFQGCNRRCEGCHNPETWKLDGGEEYTVDEVINMLSDSTNDVTIAGGEPLLQFEELLQLCGRLNRVGKNIWLYTGHTLKIVELKYPSWRMFDLGTSKNPHLDNYNSSDLDVFMLSGVVDVLIDGEYMHELRDPNLLFRGSSNQRLIDLPKSVQRSEIVLLELEESK